MARHPTLYDAYNRPVQLRALTGERARPSWSGIRSVWRGETIASGLTPERLVRVLLEADQGHPRDFLTLAEEIEERDLHYASVLGTRKRAVGSIAPVVNPASDSAEDLRLADAVRGIVNDSKFSEMVRDVLDALGKGYSAVEIVWGRGRQWTPDRYEWRDPRFFEPDRDDGRTLRLIDWEDPVEGVPLDPFKWIVHDPRIKSGLPIRGGLARAACIAWLFKAYGLVDWVSYVETYGQPYRVGKYGPDATPDDQNKLIDALANLGADAAAVIPENMMVEFVTASSSGTGDRVYERLCTYLDKQISKGVLGQTQTTDEGSSRAQAGVHNDVRMDIVESDATALASTLNRDLVRPFIDLNFGPREFYPKLALPLPDSDDIAALSSALGVLVPLGLRVGASVVRAKLGLPDPVDSDEVLAAPAPTGPEPSLQSVAIHGRGPDALLAALEEEGFSEWERQIDPIVRPVLELASRAGSYEEFSAGLAGILDTVDDREMIQKLARLMFQARGLGDARDEP